MTTYVYGITPGDRILPDDIEGVGDPPRPVRAVRSGDLAALCSDAPTELKPRRSDLLAHQHVVIEAGKDGTVLPLGFGGIAPDDETVAATLREHHDHYLETLKALDGKDEFNVKVHYDEDAVRHVVLAEKPELTARVAAGHATGGGTEEATFGELVARAVAERAEVDAALVEDLLAPYAAAVASGPEAAGRVADLSFLVPRARRSEFQEALRGLHQEHAHLRAQAVGPLPPYRFVDTC